MKTLLPPGLLLLTGKEEDEELLQVLYASRPPLVSRPAVLIAPLVLPCTRSVGS